MLILYFILGAAVGSLISLIAINILVYEQLSRNFEKGYSEGYDDGWRDATEVGIYEAHKYQ